MKIKSYEDLEVYQLSFQYTKDIYQLAKKFPKIEKFNIVDQLIRATSSIGANIAEGFGRHTTKEFIKFLYNARGSLLETRHFINLSVELGYVSQTDILELKKQNDIIGIKLNNLITVLSKKLN